MNKKEVDSAVPYLRDRVAKMKANAVDLLAFMDSVATRRLKCCANPSKMFSLAVFAKDKDYLIRRASQLSYISDFIDPGSVYNWRVKNNADVILDDSGIDGRWVFADMGDTVNNNDPVFDRASNPITRIFDSRGATLFLCGVRRGTDDIFQDLTPADSAVGLVIRHSGGVFAIDVNSIVKINSWVAAHTNVGDYITIALHYPKFGYSKLFINGFLVDNIANSIDLGAIDASATCEFRVPKILVNDERLFLVDFAGYVDYRVNSGEAKMFHDYMNYQLYLPYDEIVGNDVLGISGITNPTYSGANGMYQYAGFNYWVIDPAADPYYYLTYNVNVWAMAMAYQDIMIPAVLIARSAVPAFNMPWSTSWTTVPNGTPSFVRYGVGGVHVP